MDITLLVLKLHLVVDANIFLRQIVYNYLVVTHSVCIEWESKSCAIRPIEDLLYFWTMAGRLNFPTEDLFPVSYANHSTDCIISEGIRLRDLYYLNISTQFELSL